MKTAVRRIVSVGILLILLFARRYPGRVFLNLWNSAIAAFSAGSVFKGVLEIYGTTNSLVIVYPICGCILAVSALVSLLFARLYRRV